MQIQWGNQMTIDEWLADSKNHSGDEHQGEQYKIKKPIRLIEVFGGIGAIATALERLDCDFEIYKYSEWCAEAVEMYNAIHFQDHADYSEGHEVEELANWLDCKGISIDGKSPLPLEKILRKGEKWIRKTYNNYIATHNIGSVVNVKGGDLEINESDKYSYILSYSFP